MDESSIMNSIFKPHFQRSVNYFGGRLAGDLVDGLGESLDVAGGDTSNGDTAVLGSVDGVLQTVST